MRLRDRDRVGPVVADGQLDRARLEHRALDGELLDRRAAALAEAGPVERGERADRGDDEQQRDEAEQPARAAPARSRQLAPVALAGLHQSRDLEEALPAELGELRLVGVEHVLAGVREAPLEDPALALAEHHRVGELARGRDVPVGK